MLTAMALNAFSRRGCQLAVIEASLGGRYDSTNVIDPIVSVITRIDMEHTAVLGPTYADIAWQKAGILRRGIPSISSPQVPAAAKTIVEDAWRKWHCASRWRQSTRSGPDMALDSRPRPWGMLSRLGLGIRGAHQVENACTALAALHLLDLAGIHAPEEAIRTGLASARWPGRFERITDGTRVVVFDGAHTPAAAGALVEAWRDSEGSGRATVVLGMGADKDPHAFLTALRPVIDHLIVTRADSPRAANPELISRAAASLGIPYEVQPSVAAAVDAVTARGAGSVLITGSLFVVGEGREAFGLAEPDLEWALP